MVFCSTVGFLLVRVFKVVKGVNMPRRDYMRRVMPIGLLYAASLWLSNSAYLHLSVSFIQMTKALMPGLVYTTVRVAPAPWHPRPTRLTRRQTGGVHGDREVYLRLRGQHVAHRRGCGALLVGGEDLGLRAWRPP